MQFFKCAKATHSGDGTAATTPVLCLCSLCLLFLAASRYMSRISPRMILIRFPASRRQQPLPKSNISHQQPLPVPSRQVLRGARGCLSKFMPTLPFQFQDTISTKSDIALCLPTFSHFLIVNKTSLSLSLSLSSRSLARSLHAAFKV